MPATLKDRGVRQDLLKRIDEFEDEMTNENYHSHVSPVDLMQILLRHMNVTKAEEVMSDVLDEGLLRP